ncbi:MAG: flagellin [Alphaproteobacteria bacterium]|jgi:flagellin
MSLNIVSNFASNVAQRNLASAEMAATSSLAKLSAGSRVVSAKDDAASLAVGSRLAAEVTGLKQASVNAGQAISMLQIADGAMAQVNDVLTRMKSLAVQAGSGQLSGTERAILDTEYQALSSEINRIAIDTDFAGTQLVNGAKSVSLDAGTSSVYEVVDGVDSVTLRGDHGTAASGTVDYDGAGTFSVTIDGTAFTGTIDTAANDGTAMSSSTVVTLSNAASTNKVDIVLSQTFDYDVDKATEQVNFTGSSTSDFTFKVGTGTSATADDISVSVNGVGNAALGISATSVTSADNADTASAAISNAIDDVQTYRANIGASQNRLEFAAANIATATENTEAARSQLLDLDVASEMSSFVSKQLLIQAGVAMLAQANQLPQGLLSLFR